MRTELQQLILDQAIDRLGLTPHRNLGDCTLEEAGLEEEHSQPMFGYGARSLEKRDHRVDSGIVELIEWFSDGEDSRYEVN